MKNLILSLLLLVSAAKTNAALSITYPVPTAVFGFALCAGLGEINPLCVLALPVSGVNYLKGSVTDDEPENSGLVNRLKNALIGIILLDENTGQTKISKIDLNNLPEGISREEAITFNATKDDILTVFEDVTIEEDISTLSGVELVTKVSELAAEVEIDEAHLAVFTEVLQSNSN